MLGFLFVFTLLILCARLEWKKWKMNKRLTNFYAGPNLPILGCIGKFIGKTTEEAAEMINRGFPEAPFMPIRLWFGAKLIVGISDPEDIKIVLNSDECLEKTFLHLLKGFRLGLAFSPKHIWKRDRRALSPSFSSGIITRFLPVFNEKAMYLCGHIENRVGASDNHFKDVLVGCMANLVIKTAFDPSCEIHFSEAQTLNSLIFSAFSYVKERIVRPWLLWDFIYQFTNAHKELNQIRDTYTEMIRRLTEKLCSILAEKLKNGEDTLGENKLLTMAEKCLQLKRDGIFTDENIENQLRVLFIASIETTSSSLFNTILLLAIYPDYQERVVNELRTIFDTNDSPVTLEDVAKMKWSEIVLKEAMRFYPVLPIIARECSTDLPIKSGIIPMGAMVMMVVNQIHYDKKTWGDNADEFYPERFLPGNFAKIHPYAYLAFSGGPRNCIGMKYAMVNMKVMLAHLLRRYRFTTDLKLEDIRVGYHLTTYISNERPFQFERRVF